MSKKKISRQAEIPEDDESVAKQSRQEKEFEEMQENMDNLEEKLK